MPPTDMERKYLPEKCKLMDQDIAEAQAIRDAALDAARDSSWRVLHPDEYEAVIAYLGTPEQALEYRGSSACYVCGVRNGSHDWYKGSFCYPEGYTHYLIQHGFRPPQNVIDEAMGKVKDVEGQQAPSRP